MYCGNLGRLLRAFPDAKVIGDTRNYELYVPEAAHRLQPMAPGEKIDLGGSTFVVVPAVVHDLVNTLWAYEEERKILFVSDGYPYTHDHREGECAMTSNELAQLPRVEDTRVVIEGALGWTRYVDAQITIDRLRALRLEDLLGRDPIQIDPAPVAASLAGKTVLVTAHGNSLRALYKYLNNVSREEILELNIPTGIPLLFELNDDLTVQSFRYLGDPEAARKAAEAVANQGKAK